MTQAITTRMAEAADHGHWLALWEGYQRFYKVQIAPEVSRQTWQRLLDTAEPMFCALAEQGGQPVGLVHYIFHLSTWTTGPYVYLQDLFVAPALRGGGHGRRLIEHVYEEAGKAGASRVYWLTHETNTDAMKLYDKVAERSGFIQYRRQLG